MQAEAVLTDTQARLLEHIAKSIDLTGCQPSYRDIAKHFGWESVNAVAGHINALEKKGLVEKRGSRAVEFDWRLYLRRRK